MNSSTTTAPRPHADGHDWRLAGEAWGHAATDWSTLMEGYSVEVVDAIVEQAPITPGDRVLDVACGAGWATRRISNRGATVAGIDAAERLVEIARDRMPTAEVVHGSMFDLPWADASFDVVTSFNGIWGGCDAALDEAHRVLRPGGMLGISFWGRGEPLDLRPYFFAVAAHLDGQHLDGMKRTDSIAKPGVAEEMLDRAGFEVVERDRRLSVVEWPDGDVAWRALRSIGPVVPALANADETAVKASVLEALEGCRTPYGAYRFQNTQEYVVAQRVDI
jgi:SAM-dependent methyltransferase